MVYIQCLCVWKSFYVNYKEMCELCYEFKISESINHSLLCCKTDFSYLDIYSQINVLTDTQKNTDRQTDRQHIDR